MRLVRVLGPGALALVLVLVLVAACSGGGAPASSTPVATSPPAGASTPAGAATFPLTVADSSGHELTLRGPAQRIVSHSPAATEILFAIGAGSQVVAVDEFSYYPPEAKALSKVKYSDPSPELELTLNPDLVLFSGNQKEQVEAFRTLGLPLFYNREAESLDGVIANVRLFGRLTGRTAEAEALASKMRARIDAVTAKVADVQQGPKVFYELSDSLFTAAPNTFIGGLLSALKARNIAEGAASPFPQLTAEAVIAAGPEVILLADAAYGGAPEQVKARPGWASIPAVRDGRLHPVDPDLVNRAGPRIVDGLEMVGKLLYPERFR